MNLLFVICLLYTDKTNVSIQLCVYVFIMGTIIRVLIPRESYLYFEKH